MFSIMPEHFTTGMKHKYQKIPADSMTNHTGNGDIKVHFCTAITLYIS